MSPCSTGRPSTGASSATATRSASSSWSTSSAGSSASAFGTSIVVQSGNVGFGWTSTVAENDQSCLSLVGSSNSNWGVATGRTRARVAAFQNQPEMWLSTASRKSRSRPTRWMSTGIGTFPLRKPGILTEAARSPAACSTAWCMSCCGTSTVSRTRFGATCSTVSTGPFKQRCAALPGATR